jgi:hypothetical protein
MVPGLRLLPEGAATDQLTAVLAVPFTVAENCTWVPMVAFSGLGVTTTVGTTYVAVTVVLAFRVTLQVTVLFVVHPVHAEKLLPPAVEGAFSVTAVPES